jgi:hypothetical protein
MEKVMRMSFGQQHHSKWFCPYSGISALATEYLREMSVFPKGKYDDHVDSSSRALDWVKSVIGKLVFFE